MRLVLILFFLPFTFPCFSQKFGRELEVTYQVYIDGDYGTTYPSVLHIRDSVTIFREMPNLHEPWNKGNVKPENVAYASTSKVIEDDYLKINHSSKELLFFDRLPTEKMLVTDNYPEFKWIISSESKNIAGYPCIKASTNYRGRDWIAWFTQGIAVPYGPWKLHGLPGLILEMYDVSETFKMQVVKIKQAKTDLFDRDFKTLIATHNKEAVNYEQFLLDRDEAFENMIKKMNGNGGNLKRKATPRTGFELKYEWER
jgi:GLPGLI family protein